MKRKVKQKMKIYEIKQLQASLFVNKDNKNIKKYLRMLDDTYGGSETYCDQYEEIVWKNRELLRQVFLEGFTQGVKTLKNVVGKLEI